MRGEPHPCFDGENSTEFHRLKISRIKEYAAEGVQTPKNTARQRRAEHSEGMSF